MRSPRTKPERVNYFISYTGVDREYAEWIGWELERAGYSYILQAKDFPPGSRFIREMRGALERTDQLIAVFSPAYFKSGYASLEIETMLAGDPLGEKRLVIPVRIAECNIPTMFSDLVFIDLIRKGEKEARRALIAGVRGAKVGTPAKRTVMKRPSWPGEAKPVAPAPEQSVPTLRPGERTRIQYFPCDVGRGLDFKVQYQTLRRVIAGARFGKCLQLRAEFGVTDANLFAKLTAYRPHVVHISGNQNGGDVLFPSVNGGEVVVPDSALAGLLSSLGPGLLAVIIDTCHSWVCARRVAEVAPCAIGVEGRIFDDEATRFYEVLYQAVGAGLSVRDAYGQAVAALKFLKVPLVRIPKLAMRRQVDSSRLFLVPGAK